MKYLVPVLAMFILNIGTSYAQTTTVLDIVDVPLKVVNAFSQNGEIQDVSWTSEDGFYVASFLNEENALTTKLFYFEDGGWLKTATELEEDELDPEIANRIYALYEDDFMLLGIYENVYESKVEYEAVVETMELIETLIIDLQGKIIRRERETKEMDVMIEED